MVSRGSAGGAAGLLLLLSLLAGCTSNPTPEPPGTSPPPDASQPATSTSPAPSGQTTDPPSYTQPLVLAVHRSRSDLDVSERLARRIARGAQTRWAQLDAGPGQVDVRRGAGSLQAAMSDPDVIAVVAASRVTPMVSTVSVGGVDPLRSPDTYPLTAPAAKEPAAPAEVTIVGDIMLGRRVGDSFASQRDPGAPLRPLQRRLARADLTVGNLESTLSSDGVPRQGDDSFAADPEVLDPLDDAGFDVLSLANNHTGDFGEHAFRQTLRRLDSSPIQPVGAGLDRERAWRPVVVCRAGVRFGLVAFNAIGETPAAGPRTPGAAQVRMQPRTGPLDASDLRRATRAITSLEARADVVIVLAHWGDQYTNQPVSDQRRVGGALLDAGADVVVGGHPHWVQGVQVHHGRLVVHSLGNFIFDMDFSRETQEGVMLEAVFWGDEFKAVDFVPYVIGPGFAPRLVTGAHAMTVLDLITDASDAPFD
ncbi:MAG: CapA family protein [Nocardioidaceae bacterium]|nr:CapA family protein [Nocardioidaceae bacterium]